MTYILNAISLGSTSPRDFTFGKLIAERDEPPRAEITVEGNHLEGIRYLIVTDDGSGYRSSVELAHVPHDAQGLTVLAVPRELSADLAKLLAAIAEQSPKQELALYLEANRIISRPMPGDAHPARPSLVQHASLRELLKAVGERHVREEEVHLVAPRH